MNNKVEVLDHGFIRLIDHMGSDLSVVRNARVSYDADWRAGEDQGSDTKLINYLMNNGHNTPFESVTFTFDVMAPIFVLRQWHRHRTQSYNELSARYRELPELFYVPEAEVIGKQSTHNKQVRDLDGETDIRLAEAIRGTIVEQNSASFAIYRELLNAGTPRELARSVLPVGTYTHMFATVNMHNLFNFLRERLHPHAQYEIQQYAKAMLQLIEPIVPVSVMAFKKCSGLEFDS